MGKGAVWLSQAVGALRFEDWIFASVMKRRCLTDKGLGEEPYALGLFTRWITIPESVRKSMRS